MGENIIVKINKGLAGIVLISCVFLGGCETIGGIGKGFACGAASAAQGVGKDSHNLCEAIGKADQWIKDNLW